MGAWPEGGGTEGERERGMEVRGRKSLYDRKIACSLPASRFSLLRGSIRWGQGVNC